MNLPWNDERTRKFVTNIGLITSNGPSGENVMAAEWTHHVSYAPSLIAISIVAGEATHSNILVTKEFGVNLSALDQNAVTSVAGNYSGTAIDKIQVLKELGVHFYPGKKINVPMIQGAAMNAECQLVQVIEVGDHTMLIGEVVEISATDKAPLVFHNGQYWNFGELVKRPSEEIALKLKELTRKHARKKEGLQTSN